MSDQTPVGSSTYDHPGDRVIAVRGGWEKLTPALAEYFDQLQQELKKATAEATRAKYSFRTLLLLCSIGLIEWADHALGIRIPHSLKILVVLLTSVILPTTIFYRRREHPSFQQWVDGEGVPLYMMTGAVLGALAFAYDP
jgi:hypothetical protein